ncbi:MAG: tetratricopeptide repeat protein [Phycisphaera sp.]|nr:tetratricopeptide repeat protein [Phycisphaera sp.]
MKRVARLFVLVLAATACGGGSLWAQDGSLLRGSIVEDRAARKLLEAGDARYDANEQKKAVEIWQSVIERYPRSRVRFDAHMKLGAYLLKSERAYDRARAHFELVAAEDNSDDDQRAEALLNEGVCFYEARNFGKTFKVMREVIEKFPVSKQINQAYYYIGLGHFQLGHYSRAIEALEKVGTALTGDDSKTEKVEAGKRLYVKIEDADLAVLEQDETVKLRCRTTQGDEEIIEAVPVGRNVRVVLGSIPTDLGRPRPGNGKLEVRGDDDVEVTYVDRHTADRKFDVDRVRKVRVVGNALPAITDGAYAESLAGVVLGKEANLQITDADRDVSDNADTLKAVVEVWREKTSDELESEVADLIAKGKIEPQPEGSPLNITDDSGKPIIDRFKPIDKVEVTLTEAKINRTNRMQAIDRQRTSPKAAEGDKASPAGAGAGPAAAGAADAPADPTTAKPAAGSDFAASVEAEVVDNTIHSGVFRVTVPIAKSEEVNASDNTLQALPNDQVRITYQDELNLSNGPRVVVAAARTVEGNLGGVRVTRADISDEELRLKTKLRTATALTNIGNHYKEFGLKTNAVEKYGEALQVCEEVVTDARKLGGRILEETYVQLWRIYFEMDKLELAAAMAARLQREFPNSGFVDEAMLQLAHVARKQGNLQRAIAMYSRLVGIKESQLRGEAQFGIAECYEQMAAKANENAAAQLYERSFQEYKKVFDQFPDSGRVGEAVAKMANFYYQKKDYSRAVDVFEQVLSDQPDAKFLDVILFNYGRCLYRMERRREARQKFDQLIAEFPESNLAAESKRISDALVKAGF